MGNLTYYNNDRPEHAQFLSHPTGEFWVYGTLGGTLAPGTTIFEDEQSSPNPDFNAQGSSLIQDWYALPLMAGQTVMLELDSMFGSTWIQVRVYDSGTYSDPGDLANLYWMDSAGYETYEDEDIDSEGYTMEPMIFTAPAAGVYYVVVLGSFPATEVAGEY